MNTAELFVKSLEAEGVQYVFGVPGEENLDFLEALRKSKIRFIVTRHEQAAGFMAATVGRLTGKAGVVLTTLGPGATNLVTAAAYAQLGGMPLLMITGQKPVKKSKQGSFQIVDTSRVLAPVTKFTKQVIHGNAIPVLVRESFRRADEERPGAVHLELPEDVAAEGAEGDPFPPITVRRPVAEEKAIRAAVDMLKVARHPLILIGAGANRKRVSGMLRELIDATGIPFFTTQMGKGVVDEHHPLYLGTAALSEGGSLHAAIEKADLILNVGHDVVEKPPFLMHQGGKRKVVHINFFSAQIDGIYFPQLEVVGDIANALWQIKERLAPQPHWDFKEFLRAKRSLDRMIGKESAKGGFPVALPRVVAEVQKAMPEEGIVALDNGLYKLWFARNYRAALPNTLLLDNALATMGAGVPSAMAAKLIYPKKKVLAVAGDGGFMMNSQELETAVRLKLDLVILILNDNKYGMIEWKQKAMGMKPFGLSYGNPDFVAYARSYGASGERVKKPGDISRLITNAFKKGGVTVIEVPVEYASTSKLLSK